MSDFWILRPFNPVFLILFALFLLILTVSSLLLRKKSERTRAFVIAVACWVTLLGFFAYKYALSVDADFNVITASMGGFNWWGELPIQLCNINLLLIPIAVLTRKRPLLGFCFFVGPIGALMALVMPGNGFDGYSILLPRMLGYFGTHFVVLIAALAIGTFGLYRPRLRDLPLIVVTIFIVALIVFGINMLLRASGLHPKANYFFSVETEGNPLLELFYSWIPLPFLYLLPSIAILAAYAALVTLAFSVAERLAGGKRAAEPAGEAPRPYPVCYARDDEAEKMEEAFETQTEEVYGPPFPDDDPLEDTVYDAPFPPARRRPGVEAERMKCVYAPPELMGKPGKTRGKRDGE